MIFDGPVIERTRELIFARAKLLGHSVTADSGVHLIADGRHIEPVLIGTTRILFVLPKRRADISLRSRCFVPAHTRPPNTDGRSLGLCDGRLLIDDQPIPLDDEHLTEGWHEFERGKRQVYQSRTTSGAPLPSAARRVLIDLAGRGCYWRELESTVVALAG